MLARLTQLIRSNASQFGGLLARIATQKATLVPVAVMGVGLWLRYHGASDAAVTRGEARAQDMMLFLCAAVSAAMAISAAAHSQNADAIQTNAVVVNDNAEVLDKITPPEVKVSRVPMPNPPDAEPLIPKAATPATWKPTPTIEPYAPIQTHAVDGSAPVADFPTEAERAGIFRPCDHAKPVGKARKPRKRKPKAKRTK